MDFAQKILDPSGDEIADEVAMQANGGTKIVLTLGQAACHALASGYQDEQNIDGIEKWKRGELAVRISGMRDVELSIEELALVKKLIGKFYNSVVVFRCWRMLDPAHNPTGSK